MAIKYGLIGGMFATLLLTILYVIDPHLVIGVARNLAWLGVLVAMFVAVYRTRMELGGFITLYEGLRAAFITYLLASFLFMLYDFMLFTLIDPRLIGMAHEAMLEYYRGNPDNLSSDQFASFFQDLEKNPGRPALGGLLFKYFFFSIFGFLFSVLAGVSFRREPLTR